MLLHVAVGHTETLKRSWSDGQTNFGWHVAVKRESPRFICGECQYRPLASGDGIVVLRVARDSRDIQPLLEAALNDNSDET